MRWRWQLAPMFLSETPIRSQQLTLTPPLRLKVTVDLLSGCCRPQLWTWPESPPGFNIVGGKHTHAHTQASLKTLENSQRVNPTKHWIYSQINSLPESNSIPPTATTKTKKKHSTMVGSRNDKTLSRSIYTGMYLKPQFNVSTVIAADLL